MIIIYINMNTIMIKHFDPA